MPCPHGTTEDISGNGRPPSSSGPTAITSTRSSYTLVSAAAGHIAHKTIFLDVAGTPKTELLVQLILREKRRGKTFEETAELLDLSGLETSNHGSQPRFPQLLVLANQTPPLLAHGKLRCPSIASGGIPRNKAQSLKLVDGLGRGGSADTQKRGNLPHLVKVVERHQFE